MTPPSLDGRGRRPAPAGGPWRIAAFALVGVLTFLAVYGPRTLDVTATDWLTGGKDLTLHFLGWEFFRHDPWAFPVGTISSYGYPFGSSTSATDSITLLAVGFKLFDPVLPDRFQYFGWWTLVCFALQGIFGGLLLSRITRNRAWIFIGTAFFTLSPVMLRPSHTALCGHWLVLAALYLYFKGRDGRVSIAPWITVNVLAILIQPYLAFMTLLVYVGHEIDEALRTKKPLPGLSRSAAVVLALVFSGWAVGLLGAGAASTSRAQFGFYSMNLAALVNPMGWSSVLEPLPTATEGQTAGFNFLGLGMMLLAAVAIGASIRERRRNGGGHPRRESRISWGLAFVIASLSLFALSNTITLFGRVIVRYPLPGRILDLCAIFRSSGRMFWPVYYLIYLFALGALFRSFRDKAAKIGTAVLSVALVVQVADMAGSPLLKTKRAVRSRPVIYQSPLRSPFWADAAARYRHVVFLPPKIDDYEAFAFYALKYGMTLNTGYFARAPVGRIAGHARRLTDDVKRGVVDEGRLYVIKDPGLAKQLSALYRGHPKGFLYRVDDYDVLVAHSFPGMKPGG